MMDIKCEVIQDLLQLYVDDLCSEESWRLVEAHLEGCSECKEFLNSLKDRDSFIAEEEIEVDVSVEKKLLSKIRKRLLLIELICLSIGAFGGLYTTLFIYQFKLILIYPIIGCVGYLIIKKFWVTPTLIFAVNLTGCIVMGHFYDSVMLSFVSGFLTVIGCIMGYLLIKVFKGEQ